jgi:hypothetical protein
MDDLNLKLFPWLRTTFSERAIWGEIKTISYTE